MKRLREKLHSESGASILLAMLMFLVCILVSASILAAASSNAGKAKSNQVEHQKYLTLSSAIRLVADELERAEYTGKYDVYEWEVTEYYTETDAEGNEITYSITYYYFYCEQAEGEYTCGDLTDSMGLTDLIPLRKELDAIFAEQFNKTGYKPLTGTDVENEQKTHTLTVTLPDDLPGYPYPDSGPAVYQVPKEVTVEVTMNHATRHITLTAWLGDSNMPPQDGSGTMTAELVASDFPALNYHPGGRQAKNPPNEEAPTKKIAAKSPMKWELNWIKKGGPDSEKVGGQPGGDPG